MTIITCVCAVCMWVRWCVVCVVFMWVRWGWLVMEIGILKTHSLQWNNCLCTLRPYFQHRAALFVCIPNFTRQLPELSTTARAKKYSKGIYSQDEERRDNRVCSVLFGVIQWLKRQNVFPSLTFSLWVHVLQKLIWIQIYLYHSPDVFPV